MYIYIYRYILRSAYCKKACLGVLWPILPGHVGQQSKLRKAIARLLTLFEVTIKIWPSLRLGV